MTAFVLVHGSGQNSRGWDRLSDALGRRGHSVVAPELPKHAPDLRLADHAATIAGAIPDSRAVVVATSFGGVFLPLVAHERACAAIVFLAAVIPEPGRSLREQFTADPGMFAPAWAAAGAQSWDEAGRRKIAEEFLFHDCDAATVSWALGTVEIFDSGHLATEPSPFRSWPSVPAVSIVATLDRTITPDWSRRVCRRLLGREALEIAAGHCPHVSRPDETAALLERIASDVAV